MEAGTAAKRTKISYEVYDGLENLERSSLDDKNKSCGGASRLGLLLQTVGGRERVALSRGQSADLPGDARRACGGRRVQADERDGVVIGIGDGHGLKRAESIDLEGKLAVQGVPRDCACSREIGEVDRVFVLELRDPGTATNFEALPRERLPAFGLAVVMAIIGAMTPTVAQANPTESSMVPRDADHSIFEWQPDSSTLAKMTILDNVLRDDPALRSYHGIQIIAPDGDYDVGPDTGSVAQIMAHFHSSREVAAHLAELFAAWDGLARVGSQLSQMETSYGAKADSQLTQRGLEIRRQQRESDLPIIKRLHQKEVVLVDRAFRAYQSVLKGAGRHEADRIVHALRDEQSTKMSDWKRESENGRKEEADRCREGLRDCSFPEGVVENCAAYLGMSVDDLRKKCPHPKRLEK